MREHSTRQYKLLCIEDSFSDVFLIRQNLGSKNQNDTRFNIHDVQTLRAGMDFLKQEKVDLVLLDLNLPDCSGLESFRILKKENPSVPIIVLSQVSLEDFAIQAIREGAADYVLKEVLHSELLRFSVMNALERILYLNSIQQQREKFASILNPLCDGVVIVGHDGYIKFVNPMAEKLLGQTKEHLLNSEFPYALSRDESLEVCSTQMDGQPERVLQLQCTDIFWLNDEMASCVTLRDITAYRAIQTNLEKAKCDAERASRLKSDFLALVSHEIRTPLNGMVGMTSLLLETSLSAEQLEFVQAIRSSSDGLCSLINDILDLSKIEAGKLDLETTEFEIHALIDEALELFYEPASRKGVVIAGIVQENIPRKFVGDPFRIRQILANLLSNAVKFTTKGHICIEASLLPISENESVLHLSVEDSGTGIPKHKLEELFKPFSQLGTKSEIQEQGSGLGLAISKRLVELMGGTISVQSKQDLGSIFSFTIPLKGSTSTYGESDYFRFHGKKVLLVGSDSSVELLLTRSLQSMGIFTQTASPSMLSCNESIERSLFDVDFIIVFESELQQWEDLTEVVHKLNSAPSPKPLRILFLLEKNSAPLPSTQMLIGASIVTGTYPLRQSKILELFDALIHGNFIPREGTQECPNHRQVRHPALNLSQQKKIGKRVLLAEDNAVNQKVASKMLDRLGYDVDIVANGVEALAALERFPYALVLMDCQMPIMDGYEASKQIRIREGLVRHTPIIAMTASVMPDDVARCYECEMDDFIAKPCKLEELNKTLSRWEKISPTNYSLQTLSSQIN